MKFGLIAAVMLGTATMGTVAIAAPATDTAPITVIEQTKPVEQLLQDIGYRIETRQDGAERIVVLGSTKTQRGGPCEGYEPTPGCSITFNNGYYCTEKCGPFEFLCSCGT